MIVPLCIYAFCILIMITTKEKLRLQMPFICPFPYLLAMFCMASPVTIFSLHFSYYGPGTSLFYPMAPAAAAAGMQLTANPFGTAVTANGTMPTIGTSQAMTSAMTAQQLGHAQQAQLAAAAAAAAAAQQQQQHQQNAAVLNTAQFQLAAATGQSAAAVKTSVSPISSSHHTSSSSPAAVSNIPANTAKLGSPAAKKFRPAYTRPSHKGARYIPKPIPAELGNLKTYSKHYKLFLSMVTQGC